MYNLDDLIKINNNSEDILITRQNIIEASMNEDLLKELCNEVFRILCKKDNRFDDLFNNKFLLCLFGTDDKALPYGNHYLHFINNISDDTIKRLYKEDHDNIVANFIDLVANNIHDLLLINLSEIDTDKELMETEDLVYKAFKAYSEGAFKEADTNHLDNIKISLKNTILHSEGVEEITYNNISLYNEEELQNKFTKLKMLVSSLINFIPVGETLLMTQDENNTNRVTYYNKSKCPGYIDIVSLFKSTDNKLRMDIQEGVTRIPIIEFIDLLPSLI